MSRRAGAQASHMTAQPSCDRRGLTGRRFFDFPERTPCDPVPPTNDSAYGGVGRSKSVAPSVVEGVMKDWRPSAKGTKDYHSKTLYNNVTPSGLHHCISCFCGKNMRSLRETGKKIYVESL